MLIGCAAPPAPPTPTVSPSGLRILNWDTYIDPALLEQFTAETGIEIVYDTYASTEEAYAALTTSNRRYDLVIIADRLIDRLRREQRLAALNHEQIPHLANLDPSFDSIALIDPGYRFCVPYLWGVLGWGYRASIADRPLQSWEDVFDPTRNLRLAALDDERFSLGLALIALGFSPNTTDPAIIGAARDWFRARSANITHFAADDGQSMLARQEVDVAIEWSGDILQMQREHLDMRFTLPAEGSIFSSDSMCVPATAINQEAAEQFINFILAPEPAAALARFTRYGTPNRAAWPLLDADLLAIIQQHQRLAQAGRLFQLVDVEPAVRELYRSAWAEVRR